MFKRTVSAALVFGAAALAPPAQAQAIAPIAACGEREQVIASLAADFGERPKGAGLIGSARLMELWWSPTDGNWTILLTRPDGVTCIMATGQGWHDARPATPLPDSV